MTSLLKTVIGSGFVMACGTHFATSVVNHPFVRGPIYNFIKNTTSNILHQTVQRIICNIGSKMLSGLKHLTDKLQIPLNKIQILQNEIVLKEENLETQQQLMALLNFGNRIFIAPSIEECIYRGLQIGGGIILEQATGLNTSSSQFIVGSVTNTMFGLAHVNGKNIQDQINSEEFIQAFSKGLILTIATALLFRQKTQENRLTKALISLSSVIVGHAFSNFVAAAKQLKKDWG